MINGPSETRLNINHIGLVWTYEGGPMRAFKKWVRLRCLQTFLSDSLF